MKFTTGDWVIHKGDITRIKAIALASSDNDYLLETLAYAKEEELKKVSSPYKNRIISREELLDTARRTDFHEEVGLIDEINELYDILENSVICNWKRTEDEVPTEQLPAMEMIGKAERLTDHINAVTISEKNIKKQCLQIIIDLLESNNK